MIHTKFAANDGGPVGGLVAAIQRAHAAAPMARALPKGFLEHGTENDAVDAVAYAPSSAEVSAANTPVFRTRCAR